MSPHDAAGWMFMLVCFAGAMFSMIRRKPTSLFCPSCGYPSSFHKPGCRERDR